jgi:putative sigma-54 modulation protein
MDIKISSVHFDADKKLVDFITKKVTKLAKFYEEIIGAEIILRLENSQDLENKVSEIKLVIRGNDLFSKKQSKTFEESVDNAIDALRQQIEKHKGKIKG